MPMMPPQICPTNTGTSRLGWKLTLKARKSPRLYPPQARKAIHTTLSRGRISFTKGNIARPLGRQATRPTLPLASSPARRPSFSRGLPKYRRISVTMGKAPVSIMAMVPSSSTARKVFSSSASMGSKPQPTPRMSVNRPV